jgi:diphosphomevalonate decarboxylase
MREVSKLRRSGLAAAFTLDAGPNVHIITTENDREKVQKLLAGLPGVQHVIASGVGAGAHIVKGEINNL